MAFHFSSAMLPEGWASDVRVSVAGGTVSAVDAGVAPQVGDSCHAIALPGIASLHSHTFQRGMAGLGETRGPSADSFWSWRQVMYRYLAVLTPEDIETIAAQAFMEMLEGGFTAVGEFHYLHHGIGGASFADSAETSARIVAASVETGIGLTHLPVLYSQGGFGAAPPTEGQARFINNFDAFARLHERAAAHVKAAPDAVIGIAPHSLRAVSPEALDALVKAHPTGPVHIHIAEQQREVEDCLAWSGLRPVEWLLRHQPVDRRWCLIHATHMTPAESAAVGRSGAVAGLCPITEANLGDGIFDAPGFLGAGGAFGVGTDSNVEITAPGELRLFEYSQRLGLRARNIVSDGAGASTGATLYRQALAGGARAMGRQIGGIAPGQRADFVTLRAEAPELAAASGDMILDQYIFVAGQRLIDTVHVGGEIMVENGVHRARAAIASRYAAVMRRLSDI
jgi:formimidoylglutamate deiminase